MAHAARIATPVDPWIHRDSKSVPGHRSENHASTVSHRYRNGSILPGRREGTFPMIGLNFCCFLPDCREGFAPTQPKVRPRLWFVQWLPVAMGDRLPPQGPQIEATFALDSLPSPDNEPTLFQGMQTAVQRISAREPETACITFRKGQSSIIPASISTGQHNEDSESGMRQCFDSLTGQYAFRDAREVLSLTTSAALRFSARPHGFGLAESVSRFRRRRAGRGSVQLGRLATPLLQTQANRRPLRPAVSA